MKQRVYTDTSVIGGCEDLIRTTYLILSYNRRSMPCRHL